MAGPTSFGYQNLGFGAGVSVAAGSLELIETLTPSGVSSVDCDSLGDYNIHLFTFNNLHCDDNKDLFARVLVGGSEQSGASDYTRALQAAAPSYFYADKDPDLHSIRMIPEIGNATGECINGYVYMFNALNTNKYTTFSQQLAAIKYDGKTLNNFGATGYQQNNVVSAVRFYMSSGNFSATISVYGLKE
jgi:hypothetical protein